MHLVTATYVQNEIEPGWFLLKEDVPLGRQYKIDLDRVTTCTMMNPELKRARRIEVVWAVEPGPPGWMPLVALKVQES